MGDACSLFFVARKVARLSGRYHTLPNLFNASPAAVPWHRQPHMTAGTRPALPEQPPAGDTQMPQLSPDTASVRAAFTTLLNALVQKCPVDKFRASMHDFLDEVLVDKLETVARTNFDRKQNAEYFTPPELARKWGFGRDKVLAWIHSGKLEAINAATHTGGRPRYRITMEAIRKFEKSRLERPPPPAPRRRKAGESDDYVRVYKED